MHTSKYTLTVPGTSLKDYIPNKTSPSPTVHISDTTSTLASPYKAMKTHNPRQDSSTADPAATPLPVPTAPFELPAWSLSIGDVVSSTWPDPDTAAVGGAVAPIPRPPSPFVGAGVSAAVSMPTAVGAMVGACTENNTVAASVVHEVYLQRWAWESRVDT